MVKKTDETTLEVPPVEPAPAPEAVEAADLNAALNTAADVCDKLVADLDARTPNHVVDGKLVHEEHPTEAQIDAIVRQYVSTADLAVKLETEIRKRMTAKGWVYTAPEK